MAADIGSYKGAKLKYMLRLLGKITLGIYFVLAILVLGVRYWALPNIDQWRPQIAKQLSSRLGMDVSLGAIQAEWKGLNPSLQLRDVVLARPGQSTSLDVPQIDARLNWRSLLSLSPQFLDLDVRGMTLDIGRTAGNQWRLMGIAINPKAAAQEASVLDQGIPMWLVEQGHIVLRDATIRWTDEFRAAPPLVLKDVTMTLAGDAGHRAFSLVATPPAELGGQLEVRGHVQVGPAASDASANLSATDGRLYIRIPDMRLQAWRPWLTLPPGFRSGRVSMESWLDLQDAALDRVVVDARIEDASWDLPEQVRTGVSALRLFLDGSAAAYKNLAGEPADSAPDLAFTLAIQGLSVQADELFDHPLVFDRIDAQGMAGRQRDGAFATHAVRLAVANADLDALLQGGWKEGGSGPAGMIDVEGVFHRATIDAIDDYLPSVVDLDAREWMANSLLEGEILDARLILQGDLEHFPFARMPDTGDFKVDGRYTGGVIDYLPPDGPRKGWPRLTDMYGTASLHRADLRLTAEHALMLPTPEAPIQLTDVKARIPNIESDSVLDIQGVTAAPAAAYLDLMTHSPLGELLDGIFNRTRADGQWQVPLSLTIPLAHSEDTKVKGAIQFSGGKVALDPDLPEFSKVKGTLAFTDVYITAPDLQAQILGGPVSMEGGVGGELNGLVLQGRADADALKSYVDLAGMHRLSGQLPYQVTVQRSQNGGFSVAARSDLKGLALDFPAPIGKDSTSSRKLQIDWKKQKDGKSMRLQASLGSNLHASLIHRAAQKGGAFFQAGAIGLNQSPKLPARGLSLDIQYPDLDLDAWSEVIDEFSSPVSDGNTKGGHAVMPAIDQIRLQARRARLHGLTLDQLTFTARQPEPAQWRVDVSSSQTAGTLFWRESKGKIAGRVDANFDRLSLGAEGSDKSPRESADELRFADELDIPGVNLHVKNLRLYGRHVGELAVVGVNQARGHLWRLEQLRLSSPSAVLSGTGTWRLSGADRGLSLTAEVQVEDLGAYLDQAGFKDIARGGSGTINGQLEWRNMPWTFSKADLEGKMDVALEDGRFVTPNSNSARLLELLSLQSVKRLAKLDFQPAGFIKEGFPYDNLRGTIAVSKGVISTDNYRVTGPVGTIVIGGQSNLNTETLDLRAVVVPNLDVSGAAIAAGIAINPIVGVGAFLTQWLLQGPLAKAMTVEYRVGGTWDEPQISEVAPSGASGKQDQ